jgi:stearoyl-CoA desaturase (delta-9 desaturase)
LLTLYGTKQIGTMSAQRSGPLTADRMNYVPRTASPHCYGRPAELAPVIGAGVAVIAAVQYGRPTHAMITMLTMVLLTGLGVTLGYHRLFSHRSFATFRSLECVIMVLGCMAGGAPFFWIATHRAHHRHSDQDGDPHSPHMWAGQRLGLLRGFWHSYFEWLHSYGYSYQLSAVRDLIRRPDLVWIDRHWFMWYLVGLAIPALIGFIVGGTLYDTLIGFLWGGLLRHFIALQFSFTVNAVCHLWGARPYDTPDRSRNNFLLGLVAFGDGWHNNHHAFPRSARHGFHWWQLDLTWSVIWLMERVGLAWHVQRPELAARKGQQVDARCTEAQCGGSSV